MPPFGLSIAHISPQEGEDPLSDPTPATLEAGPNPQGDTDPASYAAEQRFLRKQWAQNCMSRDTTLYDAKRPELEVARHGELMKLHGGTGDGQQHGGGKRGRVCGYSRQSRARLMETVAKIDRRVPAALWLFITLTYPGEYPDAAATTKQHLDTFLKRLYRYAPECAALWRLEYQRRGAPHYHLLLVGRTYLDYRWLRDNWYEVVDSGDPAHLLAGTQVKAIQTWGGVTHYASKYIGKVDPDAPKRHTGRIWGIHNRAALPIETLGLPLLWQEFHQLRRLMRRHRHVVKSWPPARGPPRPAPRWEPRIAGRGAGLKLFVAEAVCYRLLRGLPTLTSMSEGDQAAGQGDRGFRRWVESSEQQGRAPAARTRRHRGK